MDKIIKELHKAYDYFNEKKFNNELIPSIILIQNAKDKKNIITYGYISKDMVWKKTNNDNEYFHEISISAEYLNRPLEDILCTLLHEMVHLNLMSKNIKHMGRGQYHKKSFGEEAQRVGMIVEESSKDGWSVTKPSEELIDEISKMDIDKSVFKFEKHIKKKERKAVKRKPVYKYECPKCGQKVSSKSPIIALICGNCKKEYFWNNKEEVEERLKELEN